MGNSLSRATPSAISAASGTHHTRSPVSGSERGPGNLAVSKKSAQDCGPPLGKAFFDQVSAMPPTVRMMPLLVQLLGSAWATMPGMAVQSSVCRRSACWIRSGGVAVTTSNGTLPVRAPATARAHWSGSSMATARTLMPVSASKRL